MRVLQVINEMGTGGAERVAAELARGPAWHSCVLSSGGVRADELAAQGVEVAPMRLVRRSPLAVLGAVRDVRRAVRTFAPDVVVAHNVLVGIVAWLALHLQRRRPPLVTVFHGVAAEDYPGAARALSRTSDAVVAVSDAVARRLRAAGLRGPRLTVVRNAVPSPTLPDRDAARRTLDVTGRFVVLCAARMVEQKRHDVLLRAWDQMPDDAVLLLAGDGPLRAGLEESAAHLRGRVRFLGARDDMDALLAAADVTVLTSDWEGLPMVVLESMAAGTPMVATDVDGVGEALGGGAGVLVGPGDPGAVARALRALRDDPARREAVARTARERIAAEHDPAVVLDRYDAVLRDAHLAPVRPGRLWVGVRAALAGVVVFAAVLAGVLAAPVTYQATVGMVARPTAGTSAVISGDVASTGYGEVVSLALPALPELATSPTLLDGVAADVPGSPSPEVLRENVSVELVPGSGVARVSVRADDAELAARLTEALARRLEAAGPLAPAGTLSAVDDRAVVGEVSPGTSLGGALALLAGLVAAAAVAALLLPRRRPVPHAALLRAVTITGREPVTVLDAGDPVLRERLRLLAGDAVPRVVAAGPGLEDPVRALAADLDPTRSGDAADRRPVVAVADRRRTRTDELAGTVAALPDDAELLAVVLV